MHRLLSWRRKRKRIRPRTVVAIVLAAALLVVLVNWLEYTVPTRRLRRINAKSLEHFSEFSRTGYLKPLYYDNMVPGDAWDLYEKAVARVESIDDEELCFIVQEFMKKTSHDSARARHIVAKNDSVMAYVSLGTRRRRCTVPLDYEDGLMLDLPNFRAIRRATSLLACRARLSVDRNPGTATDDVIDGVVLSQDLAGGGLSLIGHTIGIVCLGYSMNEIHDLLKHFYLGQPELARLAYVMNILANTWPPLTPDIDADFRRTAIFYGKPYPLRERALKIPGEKEEAIPFHKRWTDRLNSFEYDKYARRAAVGAAGLHEAMVEGLVRAESQSWGAVDSTVIFWMDKLENSRSFNPRFLSPNIQRMFERRFEGITCTRLAGAAALTELYFLEQRHWPDKLALAKTNGLEDLFVDPFTDQHLGYIVYPGEDSVVIYSVGPNMIDDGGIKDEEKDDLQLVLHRPTRSQ